MNGVPFIWVKTDIFDEKFLKNSIRTEISLVANKERHVKQRLGKIRLFEF